MTSFLTAKLLEDVHDLRPHLSPHFIHASSCDFCPCLVNDVDCHLDVEISPELLDDELFFSVRLFDNPC
jgi:hypothetical protein